MAETRHRTVLEINVDDRQVRGLGATIDRAFSPSSLEAFDRAMERTVRNVGRFVDQMDRVTGGGGRGGAGGGGGGGRGPRGRTRRDPGFAGGLSRGMGFRDVAIGTAIGTFIGQSVHQMLSRIGQGMGSLTGGSGFVQSILSGLPVAGPFLGGAVGGILQMQQSFVQAQQARARAFGGTGAARMGPFMSQAVGYGITPQEAPGILQGFAGQTGLRGRGLMEAAGPLLQYQQTLGLQGLGGVLGAAGAAEGDLGDATQLLHDAVSTGVVSGFREGRLDQFFAQFSGWVEQIRTQGIALDASSALGFVREVSALGTGFRGEAGMRAAQGISAGMQGLAQQGGVFGMMARRAAGFSPEQGVLGYMQAQSRLEDPREQLGILRNMLMDPALQSLGLGQRALLMRRMPFGLGAAQALQFAGQTGEGGAVGAFGGGLMAGAAGPELLAARQRTAQGAGVFGVPAREAALEAARVRVGAQVSEAAYGVRGLEMQLAEEWAPRMARLIQRATGLLRDAMGALNTVVEALPAMEQEAERTVAGQAASALEVYQALPGPLQEALRSMMPENLEQALSTPEGAEFLRQRLEERNVMTPTLQPGNAGYQEYLRLREENPEGFTGPPVSPEDYQIMRRRMLEQQGAPGRRILEREGAAGGAEGDGPHSLLIRGARLIEEGARALAARAVPAESDLTG